MKKVICWFIKNIKSWRKSGTMKDQSRLRKKRDKEVLFLHLNIKLSKLPSASLLTFSRLTPSTSTFLLDYNPTINLRNKRNDCSQFYSTKWSYEKKGLRRLGRIKASTSNWNRMVGTMTSKGGIWGKKNHGGSRKCYLLKTWCKKTL